MRTRIIQQEPQNGGEPCPPLEEKAGCLEYVTYQGQNCGEAHGTAADYLSSNELSYNLHPLKMILKNQFL